MKHARPPIDLATVLRAECLMHNPYPLFQRLRETAPFCWDETLQIGMATGYRECMALLHDRRFSPQIGLRQALNIPESALSPFALSLQTMAHMMFLQENDNHTRLRTLFGSPFTRASVEKLRLPLQLFAHSLLDQAAARGRIELLQEFAYPFVGGALAGILGVPRRDHGQVIRWACNIERLLVESPHPLPQAVGWLTELAAFVAYVRELLVQRQRIPGQDFLQQLITAYQQEKQSDEDEILSNIVFLLFAGIAPTAQMIGKGFALLLRHPAQQQWLVQTPVGIKPAVEEILRFDGPLVNVLRFAREDLTWGNRRLAGGQCIMVCLAAANRDPTRFFSPERFDLQRTEQQHLAFGHGAYFCAGALLARTLIEVALCSLLRHLSRPLIVQEEPEAVTMTRYLKTLAVAFERS